MLKRTQQFVDYCRRELDFGSQVSNEYQSLSVCIIDCVYSLRAKYYNTTVPVVDRYAKKYMNGDKRAVGDNTSDLIRHIQDAGGPDLFASEILKNNQKSGNVLKAEVCLKLAQYLQILHIETIDDFRRFQGPELLETVIRSVKGIGDAGANYMFMLAGDPDRCKPDVHVHHCIRDACGEDISNDDCQRLFTEAVCELRKDYPELTVAKLDGIIWQKKEGSGGSR